MRLRGHGPITFALRRQALVWKGKLKVAVKAIEDMECTNRNGQEVRALQSKLSLAEANLGTADT